MIVHVGHRTLTDPELPKGNAGTIADTLNGGASVGRQFTLKVDGVVLPARAKLPTGANVVEVVEVVEVEPTGDEPADPAADEQPAPA